MDLTRIKVSGPRTLFARLEMQIERVSYDVVRHMAMNLLRGPKDKHSLKVRQKSAAWDAAYLEAVLRQSA